MSIDQTTLQISALDKVSNTFQSEAMRGMKRKVADTTLELEQATREHEVAVAKRQDDVEYVAEQAQDFIGEAIREIRTVIRGLGDVLPSSMLVLQRAIVSLDSADSTLLLLQPNREQRVPPGWLGRWTGLPVDQAAEPPRAALEPAP